MPGALYDWSSNNTEGPAWGFSYATRMAVYKIIPETAIVAEVYGTDTKDVKRKLSASRRKTHPTEKLNIMDLPSIGWIL